MEEIDERRIGGLRVLIDRLLCVGFGDCMEPPPALFELDAEGIARFKDDMEDVSRDHLLDACRACPVDAIAVLDGDTQIVP